ncbi:MAG TPA: SprT family zinc-dependent metalloprotease [Geminicoccaceae bacterium]|nr:SprT family zinc-dependent metalloprotease [Geminicoccaceae bacterium]
MPTLELGSVVIPYRLRRSRRALRLRITVRPDGVDVVAPVRAGQAEIAAFVARHGDWVQTKVDALRRALAAHPGPRHLAAGGRIPLRGRPVELRIATCRGARVAVSCRDGFEVRVPQRIPEEEREAAIEAALRHWLKREARHDAERWTLRHGPRHGLVPQALRIKEQKQLWGSCSSRGTLNLNWRLILAPEAVFEYVVVHELCHLRVRNHQKEFWRLVEQVLPDYEAPRRWLRANGHLLSLRPARLD